MSFSAAEDAAARVPFRTVLLSVIGLWLCYFLLTTLRSELLGIGFTQELLWRRAITTLIGMGLTLGLWLALRLFDARPLWMKIVAALVLSLPVSLAIVQSNRMVFAELQAQVNEEILKQQVGRDNGSMLDDVPDLPEEEPGGAATGNSRVVRVDSHTVYVSVWQDFADIFFGRYFMMLAWCALYLALLTGEKARMAERREGEYRRAAKAEELRSLRYQVNPHFLFNTLNSLSALVLTGRTDAAERMIQTLSTFYRRSLADDPTSDVPLREEFALQKLYLDIEGVRFPQRLQAVYDLPGDLAGAKIPGMILQPLVENSVKHAVAPSSERVTLTLSAREEHGRLLVTVSDDGRAAGRRHEPRPGHGIGLSNVRDRLAARFGDQASVASGQTEQGYATSLRMPLIRDEGEG